MIWVLIYLILIIFMLFDFLKHKKILSPIFIFNFIWLFVLTLYQLKLSYLQQDLSDRTLLVFFISILTYNISYLVFSIFKLNNEKEEKRSSTLEKRLKIARRIVIIVFIIEILYSGGFPLLWMLIGSSKGYFNYGIPSLHGAFNGLVICLGAYSLYKKDKKNTIFYFLIGVLIISRQIIISMFVEGLVCMILDMSKNQKTKYLKYLKYIVLLLVMFTVIGNLRSGNDVMDNVFKPKPQYEKLSSTTKWIYSYLTFSISNFNNLVSITDGGMNHGVSMAKELLPTVILEKANITVNYSPYYIVSPNYTVSTYLPSPYLDFGLFGAALFSIIMSFTGAYTNKLLKKNNSIRNKLLYSAFIHNVLLLFFENMFLYLPIVIQFVYIIVIFGGGENEKNISYSSCL